MLGVHIGQFNEKLKLRKVEISTHESTDDLLRDGETIRYPGSMTIIVPAWKVLDLLEEEPLRKQREARNARSSAEERSAQALSWNPQIKMKLLRNPITPPIKRIS